LEEQSLRKSLIAAGAAVLAFGGTGVAVAQAPTSTVKVSISPTKAGTKKKPRAVRLKLTVTNTQTSQTAAKLKIVAPSQITLSTKGFKTCSASKLANSGPKACPSGSQVGPTGVAHAMAGVSGTSPQEVSFQVTPFATGKKTLGFYLQLAGGAITGLAKGTISGHTLTVNIPSTPAQQYPAGVYNGLVDLTTDLWVKHGKGVVQLSGCPASKQLKFTNTITFVNNPNPPAVPTSTASGIATCKK
jgi:hypothetical protein